MRHKYNAKKNNTLINNVLFFCSVVPAGIEPGYRIERDCTDFQPVRPGLSGIGVRLCSIPCGRNDTKSDTSGFLYISSNKKPGGSGRAKGTKSKLDLLEMTISH